MKRSMIMRRVVLPQAMRIIIPPTGNEFIGMLKTTSLVNAVPFTLELQFATTAIATRLYKPIPLLIVACIWYLVITSILMVLQSRLEKHFGKGFDARPAAAAGQNRRRTERRYRQAERGNVRGHDRVRGVSND